MRILNLYVDSDGESHFRDIDVEWKEVGPVGKQSERFAATGIIFRRTEGDYNLGWHNAPRRQYIINLDAGVRLTASDGESRTLGAGEVLLVEDVIGKGHLSQAIDGQVRHSVFIPIE
jgi:quercetin dioxygenase-like cupin family protein